MSAGAQNKKIMKLEGWNCNSLLLYQGFYFIFFHKTFDMNMGQHQNYCSMTWKI